MRRHRVPGRPRPYTDRRHRRGPAASATSRQRLEGLQLALHEAGAAYNPRLAPAIKEFDRYNGLLAMGALAALSACWQPDAVFCFSDLLAVGAQRALFESGLGIPDDVAVAAAAVVDPAGHPLREGVGVGQNPAVGHRRGRHAAGRPGGRRGGEADRRAGGVQEQVRAVAGAAVLVRVGDGSEGRRGADLVRHDHPPVRERSDGRHPRTVGVHVALDIDDESGRDVRGAVRGAVGVRAPGDTAVVRHHVGDDLGVLGLAPLVGEVHGRPSAALGNGMTTCARSWSGTYERLTPPVWSPTSG
ncbi:substrate-binding domain-containing protein [Streptomyces violaceusniger]